MHYNNSYNDFDVVISTNITISRNLNSYPFPNKMDEVQIVSATDEIITAIFKEGNLNRDAWEVINNFLNSYVFMVRLNKEVKGAYVVTVTVCENPACNNNIFSLAGKLYELVIKTVCFLLIIVAPSAVNYKE